MLFQSTCNKSESVIADELSLVWFLTSGFAPSIHVEKLPKGNSVVCVYMKLPPPPTTPKVIYLREKSVTSLNFSFLMEAVNE